HRWSVELAHPLAQPGFVDSPHLLKQDDAVAVESAAWSVELDVSRQPRLAHLRGYRSGYDGGAVLVARVVLDYEHGSHASLFAADDGAQVGIEDISASYHAHVIHTPIVVVAPFILCRPAAPGVVS